MRQHGISILVVSKGVHDLPIWVNIHLDMIGWTLLAWVRIACNITFIAIIITQLEQHDINNIVRGVIIE